MKHYRPVIVSFSSLTELFKAQISEVVSVYCHARGINTLSESRSGSAWHRRYRKDFGSLHSVCLVVRKYVPPTFRRTHLDKPPADGCSLSPGERAGHLRALEPLGSGLFSAIPPLRSRCLHWWWNWARAGSVRSLRAAVPSHPSQIHYRLCLQTHSADYPDGRQERCARSDALEFYLDRQLVKFWHVTMIFLLLLLVFYSNC